MNELLALIRSGSGPDRAIDAELAKMRGWADVRRYSTGTVTGRLAGKTERSDVPAFMASMDAAAELFEPEWDFEVARAGDVAAATAERRTGTPIHIKAVLPTPARALCFVWVLTRMVP